MSALADLPPSWVECTLGDIVDYGSTQKAEPEEIPDEAWILELEDIEKDTSRVLQKVRFAQRQSRSTKNRFVRGDVLYGKLRPYLNKVVRANEGGYCTTEIVPLTPTKGLDGGYLFYWLKHPRFLEYVTAVSHGLNMPRLGTNAGRAAPFVLAPSAEQKRIADKLDALLARVDRCSERLEKVVSILKRFRQAVLDAATTGDLTREWRKERGLRKSWQETRIEEIASVGTGSTPLRSNRSFYSKNGVPWITSAATGLPFVTHADEFVSRAAIAAHRLKLYPVGTILVAMYGEGKTRGQVTELRIAATINQACAAISVDESKATRAFVRLALESNYLQMRDLAEGGNQPNLNLSKIKEFPLSLPPMAEQKAITERVEAMMGWLGRIQQRTSAAKEAVERLRSALLAKAFRGELVSQDPNDEPASELLARIRHSAPSGTSLRPTSNGDTRAKPRRGRSQRGHR